METEVVKIDWEESTNAGRVCIRPHIDEELDNRKHVYHGIDSVLVSSRISNLSTLTRPLYQSTVAEQICERMPYDYASSLNVVYFPQLGSSCRSSGRVLTVFQDSSSAYQCWMNGARKREIGPLMDGVFRRDSFVTRVIRLIELPSFHRSAPFLRLRMTWLLNDCSAHAYFKSQEMDGR